jgi:hypothetical protein
MANRLRLTRTEWAKAQELLDGWRLEGAPFTITAYEAHSLTGGAVGVPRGSRGDTRPLHLAEVAAACVKRTAKKGGRS